MSADQQDILKDAMQFLQKFVETEDPDALEGLNALLGKLSHENDSETSLLIAEKSIEMFPNSPYIYYNAAKACEYWSDKLASDHFALKQGHSMHPLEWMCGEGTPYSKVKELRSKAAGYLEKAIDLDTDLPTEMREAIEEKISLFRWA